MIEFIEISLIILGAFQPLITFLIGCAAVYISFITYKNAKLAREHTVDCQIFNLKRDIHACCAEYINNASICVGDLEDHLYLLTCKLDSKFKKDDADFHRFTELIKSQEEVLKSVEEQCEKTLLSLSDIDKLNEFEKLLFKIEKKKINSAGVCLYAKNKSLAISQVILMKNEIYLENLRINEQIQIYKDNIG